MSPETRRASRNVVVRRGPLRPTDLIPWRGKLISKLVLSRLPLDYRFWKRISLFEHGRMDRPEYALNVCRTHFQHCNSVAGQPLTALELGPGDSVASALIARALGARRVVLVDVGPFASTETSTYFRVLEHLRNEGLTPPDIGGCRSVATILERCDAEYHIHGIRSLAGIPDRSVDFIWSHAVLEHVRRTGFDELQRQLRRLLRPGGVCSHVIDLRDHFNMGLNHLRFSPAVWESAWFASAGFYTNRLRRSEICSSMRLAGFTCAVVSTKTWPALPLSRSKLHPEFQRFHDDELSVSGFHVVCS